MDEERKKLIVEHARNYAANFADAGIPGHTQLMLVAELSEKVETLEQELKKTYYERNLLALLAGRLALGVKYRSGLRSDPRDPNWPILFIDLPTGQTSWHVPAEAIQAAWPLYFPGIAVTEAGLYGNTVWDGHTTEEKYDRVERYVNGGSHAG